MGLLLATAFVQPVGTALAGDTDWAQVSAGPGQTCAIKTTGQLFCWGLDDGHQVGNGGTNANQNEPVEVAGGGTDWDQVTTGQGHTCARTTTLRIFCWGRDVAGQVGNDPALEPQKVPVEVAGGSSDWTDVSAGGDRTCAVKDTGQLFCWGRDDYGSLGNGLPHANQAVPVPVAGGATNWADVTVGDQGACALKTTGRLFCWGRDDFGQLGNDGSNTSSPVPVPVAGGATNWASVTLGSAHTCARKTTGRLYCWGNNFSGQLGTGGGVLDARDRPTPVAGAATTWVSVDAGGRNTCAMRSAGRIFCWGDDFFSQLGDGGADTDRNTPTRVSSSATNWSSITAGGGHACATKTTGRLFCWGNDFSGELGNGGDDTNRATPGEVA